MSSKLRVGVSACLLGQPVRYDGAQKTISWVADELGNHVTVVAICPEVGAGMPVPRPPIELVQLGATGLRARLVDGEGDVHTPLDEFCKRMQTEIETKQLHGYLFKARSPSCGVSDTPYFSESGEISRRGPGLWARAILLRWPNMPVADESQVLGQAGQQEFLARVREYGRQRASG